MILFVLLCLCFLFNPKIVFSVTVAPLVSINNISDTSIVGQSFSVDFSVINADVGTSFYYKIFGGLDDNTSSLQTFNNSTFLNYNSAWINFPIITPDNSGIATISAYARADDVGGKFNVRVRIAKIDKTSSKYDSEPKSIDIIAPSPTLVPTATPTPSPTSTPTPKPPTCTPTIVPTKIPTATPTVFPTDAIPPVVENLFEPPSAESSILGDKVVSPTPKTNNSNFVKNKTGIIFIALGGLLLLSPPLITKLQQWKKNSSKK